MGEREEEEDERRGAYDDSEQKEKDEGRGIWKKERLGWRDWE